MTAGWLLTLALVGCRSTPQAPVPGGARLLPGEGLPADHLATQRFFAQRPLYERPLVEGLEPPTGVGSWSARACQACHPEFFAEWEQSVHAVAWIDPQFQAEIQKSDNRWLCRNCHTPLLVQQPLWPVALEAGDVEQPHLVPNPAYDAALEAEGITCLACHLRPDGSLAGPGLGGKVPHPVTVDPDLRSGALCERCHDAQAEYPGKSFVCTFWTGEEWQAGPWPAAGKGCVDCHMPPVERPVVPGGPVRSTARHWWRGAGIPKIEGRYPPFEANPPGLQVELAVEGEQLVVFLANARAGHHLPTGDPERFLLVEVTFLGAEAQALGRESYRVGQEWSWGVPPQKRSDNRLLPGERRPWAVPVPAGTAEVLVEASSHRLTEENARWHHLEGYPRSVVTHRARLAWPDVAGLVPLTGL